MQLKVRRAPWLQKRLLLSWVHIRIGCKLQPCTSAADDAERITVTDWHIGHRSYTAEAGWRLRRFALHCRQLFSRNSGPGR